MQDSYRSFVLRLVSQLQAALVESMCLFVLRDQPLRRTNGVAGIGGAEGSVLPTEVVDERDDVDSRCRSEAVSFTPTPGF